MITFKIDMLVDYMISMSLNCNGLHVLFFCCCEPQFLYRKLSLIFLLLLFISSCALLSNYWVNLRETHRVSGTLGLVVHNAFWCPSHAAYLSFGAKCEKFGSEFIRILCPGSDAVYHNICIPPQ